MSRRVAAALIAALVLPVAACQRDDRKIELELTAIHQELTALRAAVASRPQGQGQAQAPRKRPGEPDPAKVYAVSVDSAPSMGKADALVTVVMAYEYACPWCQKQRAVFDEIKQAYGDDVRFVYRPYIVHADVATDAALAACAGAKQGKFESVDAALWRDVFGKRAYERADVERVAAAAGLDPARLRADMDGACKDEVGRQQPELSGLGVTGTPGVWVNGRGHIGFRTLAQIKPVLDEELARARERVAAGTPRSQYYAEWVMKKGAPKVEAGS